MTVNTDLKHFECKKCGTLFQNFRSERENCSKGGQHNFKTHQTSWNSSALGGTVNLLGKGVGLLGKGAKVGASKLAEYNSQEAKELREQKKKEKEEERIREEEEEKRKKNERLFKSDKFKAEGKPLTAFLVKINPIVLYPLFTIFGFILFLGGKKYGILFIGGFSTILLVLFSFIICDYFKFTKKNRVYLILSITAISISITSFFYFSNNEKNTVTQEQIDNLNKEPLIKETELIKEETINIEYYRIDDPDGYSNLREKPKGKIIKKVYENTLFEVIGKEGQYMKVKLPDATIGYIHNSRVIKE